MGSSLYLELSENELTEIVSAALHTEMASAQLLTGGLFNTTYLKEPRLVHADLWPGNILISADTPKPRFAAIIDADRAIWGDPDFEFSSIRWTYSEDSFWEGYGRKLPQSPAARIRRGIYTLLNRLWNTYGYLCEYNQPEKAASEQSGARDQMSELCELLNV